MPRSPRRLDSVRRSIVVVAGGRCAVPTICYQRRGRGDGWLPTLRGGRGSDVVALSLLQVVVAWRESYKSAPFEVAAVVIFHA